MVVTGKVEDGPRDDPLPDVVSDLEVRGQELLGFLVQILFVLRDGGRVEEVEEGVVLDLLGHRPHVALGLVLLLLLHRLDCQILPGFPVDRAA